MATCPTDIKESIESRFVTHYYDNNRSNVWVVDNSSVNSILKVQTTTLPAAPVHIGAKYKTPLSLWQQNGSATDVSRALKILPGYWQTVEVPGVLKTNVLDGSFKVSVGTSISGLLDSTTLRYINYDYSICTPLLEDTVKTTFQGKVYTAPVTTVPITKIGWVGLLGCSGTTSCQKPYTVTLPNSGTAVVKFGFQLPTDVSLFTPNFIVFHVVGTSTSGAPICDFYVTLDPYSAYCDIFNKSKVQCKPVVSTFDIAATDGCDRQSTCLELNKQVVNNACVCAPKCAATKPCGDNGCNGACGAGCGLGEYCVNGSCITKKCSGAKDVIFGGDCCSPNTYNSSGVQVKFCGNDGCGGVSGECSSEQICCGGMCVTADSNQDCCPDNCPNCKAGSLCSLSCEGRECGRNECCTKTCGATNGTCSSNLKSYCSDKGTCVDVPRCDDSMPCANGFECVSGRCMCNNTHTCSNGDDFCASEKCCTPSRPCPVNSCGLNSCGQCSCLAGFKCINGSCVNVPLIGGITFFIIFFLIVLTVCIVCIPAIRKKL